MPSLDPQVAMYHLNIKPDAKPIKQQQRWFWPDIMEAIEAEVQKLIECGFIREEQHPDWVANIVPVLKKNGKIRVCIDFRDLNIAVLKTNFRYPSWMSWLITRVVSKRCHLWMASRGTIKPRCTRMMKIIHYSEHRWVVLLYDYAIWLKEHRCHLPACNEHNLPWSLVKDSGVLCWRHCNQKSRQEQPSPLFENNIRSHADSPSKNESDKVFFGSFKWQVPRIHCHI